MPLVEIVTQGTTWQNYLLGCLFRLILILLLIFLLHLLLLLISYMDDLTFLFEDYRGEAELVQRRQNLVV